MPPPLQSPTIRAAHRRRPLPLLLLAAALSVPAPTHAQDTLPDPFSGIVHHHFANGLTLWVKPLRGAGVTSISVAVPYGSDRDPAGHEELAHMVEHALFSARDGRTEEQITREISDRGGSFNATTSPDRTLLWVAVGREHGGFALDWLFDRVRPRDWDPEIMPGVRDAVALELGIGPRSLLDWIRDEYVLQPVLMPEGFWSREFGLQPPEYRRPDYHAALERTGIAEIEAFYRLHYNPSRMSLLVAGDVDPERTRAAVEQTFGQLGVWPEQPPPLTATLKRTPTHRFFWNLREDVGFSLSFRLDSLDVDDYVRLLFAQQLLERRLIRRLRWGEQQAVYGIRSSLVERADVALLRFEARIQPAAFDEARAIIEDELQRLRHGRYPPGEFEQDREALDRTFRLNNGGPIALRGWHATAFYRTDRYRVPPPVGVRFAAMTPDELAATARAQLGPSREILSIERPLPLGQGAAAAIPLLALGLGILAARRTFITPIDLPRIRYLARLRPPLLLAVPAGLLTIGVLLAALRLLAAGMHHAAAAFVWNRDSFALQAAAFLLAITLATFLLAALLTLVPRRVLVLEHEARIKYLAYRSTVLRPEDIEEVRLARFADVFGHRRAFRTVPLALGWRAPAVLIRNRRGFDWFIATRDSGELATALARLCRPTPPGPDPRAESSGAS